MMSSNDRTFTFDLVIPGMVATNQKQVWRMAALEASSLIGLNERILAERLMEQEKQSPSAMGGGAAIAHLHMGSLNAPVSLFAKLKNSVDFGAADNMPVDLLCLLLTPEREGSAYLREMARLSRTLRNQGFCDRLREAQDEKTIRTLFAPPAAKRMAA